MGPRFVRLSTATLVALVVSGASGGGQVPTARQQQPPPQQPQQPPVFRAGVKLVRVDLSVTGKGDLPVADLQAGDFDVTEDGVPQKVDQLQFVQLDGKRPPGDESSLDIRSQEQAEAEAAREDVRVFAIFFDDYHVDKEPQIMIPLRRALTEFVGHLWPSDLVVLMDPLTTLSALKFTRSKADLIDDIRQLKGRQGEMFPVKSVIEEAQLQSGDVDRIRAQVSFSALTALVVKLGGLREGRKSVIFVSQGPRLYFPSRGISLQEDLNEVTNAANQGNTAIYTVDPRGLGLDNRAGDRNTLLQLAAETGGRATYNTNNFAPGMATALADASAYYVLGYVSTRAEDDGKFHKISVKIKRSGMKVLGRQGYWAPSSKDLAAAAAAASKVVEPNLAATLKTLSESVSSKRLVETWVGASRSAEGRTQITVTWDPTDVVQAAAIAGLEAEVLSEPGGKPIQPAQDLPAMMAGKSIRTKAVFVLEPRAALLGFRVRSLDGTIVDHWTQPLTVPDFAAPALALSTAEFYRARSFTEFRALQAAKDPVPSALRQFNHSERVLVAVECYGLKGAEAPVVEVQLLTTEGRELTALPSPPLENGRTRFELPVGSLGAGAYVLRVRGRTGTNTTEQLIAFRVGS
jgi:VWFA-related protein